MEKKPKTILEIFHSEEVDPASQLVARYNGSSEIPEIIKWISQIIKDGDSVDLPFYRTKAPELVPEREDPIWSMGTKSLLSKEIMKQKAGRIFKKFRNFLGDPRIGPILLLAALMSCGNIWLRRSQSTRPGAPNHQSQPTRTDRNRPRERRNRRDAPNQDIPPSITDMGPTNAYQMKFSDSDSD
ncbi:hypothetical protein NMG60_11004242 [Bertholletia excelsa]